MSSAAPASRLDAVRLSSLLSPAPAPLPLSCTKETDLVMLVQSTNGTTSSPRTTGGPDYASPHGSSSDLPQLKSVSNLSRPPFRPDLHSPAPGDWSSATAGRYSGLPTPSLGMDDSIHAQAHRPAIPQGAPQGGQPASAPAPQAAPPTTGAPQQMYYGHFDPGYTSSSQTTQANAPLRPDERFQRPAAPPAPTMYNGQHHDHYYFDPNDPSRYPHASALNRSDPHLFDERYGYHLGRPIPDPPFFEGTSMIPTAPPSKKRPKARIDGAARKQICQYAQLHPDLRQADIAAVFNVERSTVSKILKQKAKWLAFGQDDGNGGAPNGSQGANGTGAGSGANGTGSTGVDGNGNGKARAGAAAHGRRLSSATAQLRGSPAAQPVVHGSLYNLPEHHEGPVPVAGEYPRPGAGLPFIQRPTPY